MQSDLLVLPIGEEVASPQLMHGDAPTISLYSPLAHMVHALSPYPALHLHILFDVDASGEICETGRLVLQKIHSDGPTTSLYFPLTQATQRRVVAFQLYPILHLHVSMFGAPCTEAEFAGQSMHAPGPGKSLYVL